MNPIMVLDQHTIDKIAAGEVVERPASVVKELVENSIDAGARMITVEILAGGKCLIRVTDNGGGIDAGQVPTAFLSHATSKLRQVEDLEQISSLGFRGEALSSIAAVAKVELITKTREAVMGTRFCIEGGKAREPEEVGANDGTSILVSDLFFNTPARRKFLKSDNAEAGEVGTLMEQLALSHPDVAMKFMSNGQMKLQTPGSGQVKDVIYNVYGREVARAILPVAYENDFLRITGFAGRPEIARGNRGFENYCVNGRFVRNTILSKAIEDAYKGFLMQHKFPFVMLALEMRGDEVDVNVHPRKLEVRFSRGSEVYDAVFDAVRGALTGRELIQTVSPGKEGEEQEPERPAQEKPGEDPERKEEEKPREEPERKEEERRILPPPAPAPRPRPSGNTEAYREIFTHRVGPAGNAGEEPPERPKKAPGEAKIPGGEEPAASRRFEVFEEEPAPYGESAPEPSKAPELSKAPAPGEKQPPAPPSEEEWDYLQTLAGAEAPPAEEPGEAAPPVPETERRETEGQETGGQEAPSPEAENRPEKKESHEQLSFEEPFLSTASRPKHRLIGRLFDTYLLVEFEDKFFLIDQHAAHEKVYYERFVKRFQEQDKNSQLLDPPLLVSLRSEEEVTLRKNMDQLKAVGFEIDHYGGREYCIRAVPENLYGFDEEELFREFLDNLRGERRGDAVEVFAHRLATMACKAAVKGGDVISLQEADALIDELLSLENPYHCPHGRPTIICMTREDIEKKFRRIV